MSKINVLESAVFNRIAAGEVVDKPASVVKELVENAIDSGAGSISVYVNKGGRYIRVTDNGCGIAEADIKTAFLPHATSKIKEISDLDSIGTLGFRGEALPSIASVAKVTMLSKREEDELGTEYITENGKEISFVQKGAPNGTTVTVEELFANVPARLKFMRSDRSEDGDISSLMQRMIMANFNIAFSFYIEDKEVYRSDGKGLKEAVYSVYGMNFLKETEFISCTMSDIALYGYINKPAFSKHNRSYQTLIVNGRYVINSDISFWIYNCFSNFLMKRQYPAYILFLELPDDMVDINVHPSKMEVKFVDFGIIRKMLSSAISEALQKSAHVPKEIELNNGDASLKSDKISDIFYSAEESDKADSKSAPDIISQNRQDSANDIFYSDVSIVGNSLLRDSSAPVENNAPQIIIDPPVQRQFQLFHDIIFDSSELKEGNKCDLSDYKYIGKMFNTYLMLEKGDEVIIIDQHAAHERILYEEFVESVESGANTVQNLLVPYIFDVSAQESVLIDDNMDEITSLGFVIGALSGQSYSLSALPLVLSGVQLEDLVSSLISALKTCRLSKKSFLKEELMQSACKAAVKGKMDLSDNEISKLIQTIEQRNIELFCPHGRPIAVKVKITEIEKWFKRIV